MRKRSYKRSSLWFVLALVGTSGCLKATEESRNSGQGRDQDSGLQFSSDDMRALAAIQGACADESGHALIADESLSLSQRADALEALKVGGSSSCSAAVTAAINVYTPYVEEAVKDLKLTKHWNLVPVAYASGDEVAALTNAQASVKLAALITIISRNLGHAASLTERLVAHFVKQLG